MPRPELRVEYVPRADLDEMRKRIAREGRERLLSIVPEGDEWRVTLEALPEPPVEIR